MFWYILGAVYVIGFLSTFAFVTWVDYTTWKQHAQVCRELNLPLPRFTCDLFEPLIWPPLWFMCIVFFAYLVVGGSVVFALQRVLKRHR